MTQHINIGRRFRTTREFDTLPADTLLEVTAIDHGDSDRVVLQGIGFAHTTDFLHLPTMLSYKRVTETWVGRTFKAVNDQLEVPVGGVVSVMGERQSNQNVAMPEIELLYVAKSGLQSRHWTYIYMFENLITDGKVIAQLSQQSNVTPAASKTDASDWRKEQSKFFFTRWTSGVR